VELKPERVTTGIIRLLGCFLPLLFLHFAVIGSESNSQRIVRLAVTSDLHGWMSTSLLFPTHKRSGLLHLAADIRRLRLEEPELILLDGGDLLEGSPLVDFFHRHHDNPAAVDPFFQLVRQLEYDAVAVGNHDLGINPLYAESYMPASNFSWLAANLNWKGNAHIRPYVVMHRFGLKIAVLGFTTPGSRIWLGEKQLDGIRFDPVDSSAQAWLKKIRRRHEPDLIIGLFHSGLYSLRDDENAKISRISPPNALRETLSQIDGFDLVVAGHDHRLSPSRSDLPVRYIMGTPVVEGGKWGEAFLDLSLDVQRRKGKWRVAGVTCRVRRASTARDLDSSYLGQLPPDYLEFLHAPLPYTWTSTSQENVMNCLNRINALAHSSPEVDGSLLPRASANELSNLVGRQLRRLELYKIFRHDNRTVTVQLSAREIQLLEDPVPESGRRQVPSNRVLFGWFKAEIPRSEEKGWFLQRKQFEPLYRVRISDYHYHGGAGIIPSLFLSADRTQGWSEMTTRERVFAYLRQGPSLPEVCGFLRPLQPGTSVVKRLQ